MTTKEPSVQMDFNETSLDHARNTLGASAMHMLKVFVNESDALRARQAQGLHGFELIVVPICFAVTPYAWCAQFGGDIFLSRPE